MARTSSIGKTIVGLVVVGGLLGGGAYWAMNRDQRTESQLIKGKVERGMIRISVQATGTLEAVRTVQVGSQISGQISALHADYNSIVRKGQLLAEIDPRTFESQVLTEEAQNAAAQARFQSSQADLINQEANLVQVESNLKVAQLSHDNTTLLFERAKQLGPRCAPRGVPDRVAPAERRLHGVVTGVSTRAETPSSSPRAPVRRLRRLTGVRGIGKSSK